MVRYFLLIGFVALLAACEDANKPATPGKDSPSAAAANSSDKTADCKCAEGKSGKAVWCEKCGYGYVDGRKVTDKAAFDKGQAGAAKGHECGEDCAECAKKVDKDHECGEDCADCAKHADHKGCDKCGKDGGQEGCDECGEHKDCQCAAGKKGSTVWCDKCKAGFVDGKMITDKAAFEKAKLTKE